MAFPSRAYLKKDSLPLIVSLALSLSPPFLSSHRLYIPPSLPLVSLSPFQPLPSAVQQPQVHLSSPANQAISSVTFFRSHSQTFTHSQFLTPGQSGQERERDVSQVLLFILVMFRLSGPFLSGPAHHSFQSQSLFLSISRRDRRQSGRQKAKRRTHSGPLSVDSYALLSLCRPLL